MAWRGWFGLPLFGKEPEPKSVACVLSGGGSRASFQLGALAYLYRHDPEFAPTTFVGTSAGAILAAALAQYGSPSEQAAITDQLSGLWHELKTSDEMFTPRPWLARILEEAPDWLSLMKAPPPQPRNWLPWKKNESSYSDSPSDPLALALRPDEDTEPVWSLGVIAELASNMGKLPKLGNNLAAAKQGLTASRSLYRPGPLLARLLEGGYFDADRIAAAGTTLRLALVGLDSGELRFMREDGAIVDRQDRLLEQGPHKISLGVLASCAIPGVFRPVPIGQDVYIDGGTRENLPAELAIGVLGAGKTYVISSQCVGVPERSSMADDDVFSVVMRATEILIDEAGRDELAYATSAGAIVVHPELNVHDAMRVHPGLLDINRDYGWLRAAEQHLGLSEADEELHARIIRMRMRCLQLEERFLEAPEVPEPAASLAAVKQDLRDVVAQVNPEALPPDAGSWWRRFERHEEKVTLTPTWMAG